MTVLEGSSTERDDAPASSRSGVPARADGVELIGRDGRLRLPGAARAGPSRRRPDHPADPAALPGARARSTAAGTYDEVAEQVDARRTARTVSADNIAHAGRRPAAAARPAAQGRRLQPELKKSNPLLGAAVQVRRHRPGADPPDHRAVRRACSTPSWWSRSWRRSLSSAGGCSSTRASPRRRTRRSTSRACCCWSSRSPSSRPASTSSATRPPRAGAAPRPG